MINFGFNPQARWDRRIPSDAQEHEEDGLFNEKIEVLALFKGGKAYPQSFTWKNKSYSIQRISYAWQERLCQGVISYFSVDSATDIYQISFNNTSLEWKLNKVIT